MRGPLACLGLIGCLLVGWPAAAQDTEGAGYVDSETGESEEGGLRAPGAVAIDTEGESARPDPDTEIDPGDPTEQPNKGYMFLGAYYRQLWVPGVFQEIFLAEAPGTTNPAAGVQFTYRKDGFSIVAGLGYAHYGSEGAFRAKNDPARDTEYIDSSLGFIHASASFLWSTDFNENFALEYGLGFDLGVVVGSLRRDEAYRDASGEWQPCPGPVTNPTDPRAVYCEPPPSGDYTDVERLTQGGDIPDVFLLPALPHLAFRWKPHRRFVGKIEFAFNLLQMWIGASAHYGL